VVQATGRAATGRSLNLQRCACAMAPDAAVHHPKSAVLHTDIRLIHEHGDFSIVFDLSRLALGSSRKKMVLFSVLPVFLGNTLQRAYFQGPSTYPYGQRLISGGAQRRRVGWHAAVSPPKTLCSLPEPQFWRFKDLPGARARASCSGRELTTINQPRSIGIQVWTPGNKMFLRLFAI